MYIKQKTYDTQVASVFTMVYSCNRKCSVFCLFMSIWGIIQCLLMGAFYQVKSLGLVEYLPLKDHYKTLDEFQQEADGLFQKAAIRCYVSGIVYGFFVVLCLVCIRSQNRKMEIKHNKMSLLVTSSSMND